MAKIKIVTDSNSGITQLEGHKLGIAVMPMPFYINDELFYEDINLSQEQFYEKLKDNADIKTSAPSPGEFMDLWDDLLKDYDQIIHIPMSSGLSGTCGIASAIAKDSYEGKVWVVDNQRISVTMRQSAIDAKNMADAGMEAQEIYDILMKTKMDSSIYIMVDTLYYLKKGGRITPAAAAIGSLLKLKPVLQIQGEKLDAFSKARTVKQAKTTMIHQVRHDCENRFNTPDTSDAHIAMAYTYDLDAALEFKKEVETEFPGHDIVLNPLSLSVSCHIGPGALAITATKKLHI